MLTASIILALIAAVNVFLYRDYFIHGWRNLILFQEAHIFSTISFSKLLFFGLLAMLLLNTKNFMQIALKIFFILLLAIPFMLMMQRTHIALSVVVFIMLGFLKLSQSNVKWGAIIITITVVSVVTIIFFQFLPDTAFDNMLMKFQGLGSSYENRKGLIEEVINDISIFGHGLGAFEQLGDVEYVHNIYVEAAYEEGLGAGLLLLVISLIMLYYIFTTTVEYYRQGNAIVVFLNIVGLFWIIHMFKAGVILAMDAFIFISFVIPTVSISQLQHKTRRSHSKRSSISSYKLSKGAPKYSQ
jgi:hypothetical protein